MFLQIINNDIFHRNDPMNFCFIKTYNLYRMLLSVDCIHSHEKRPEGKTKQNYVICLKRWPILNFRKSCESSLSLLSIPIILVTSQYYYFLYIYRNKKARWSNICKQDS